MWGSRTHRAVVRSNERPSLKEWSVHCCHYHVPWRIPGPGADHADPVKDHGALTTTQGKPDPIDEQLSSMIKILAIALLFGVFFLAVMRGCVWMYGEIREQNRINRLRDVRP